MKKNKLLYSIFLSLIVISSGCIKEDSLQLYSQTDFYDDKPFETPARIEHQVRGFYSGLRAGNLYGSRYLIYNDVRAENFLSNDPNRVTARAAWEFSEADTDNEVNNLWAACYSVINRANIFLDGMEARGNVVVGDQLARQYQAEARFSRALSYYSLLQFYAQPYPNGNGNNRGLPLRLTGIQEYGFNDLAFSTVAQVYDQIIQDLDFAENNLPLAYGTTPAGSNVTRAHKNTAIALKVRVYLSMAKYPEVISEANKIVSQSAPFTTSSGVTFQLHPNLAQVFSQYTTPESIFSMPFNSNEQPGTQNQLGFYYKPNISGTGAAGIFYLNPSGIWGNSDWGSGDVRRSFVLTHDSKTWLNKFSLIGPFLDWAPVMRYSEVLLSLSEAITRNTQTVDDRAVELLHAVRHRADPSVSYTSADFADADELIDAILLERNIEFLGEGIRSIDILRLVQPFPAKSVPGGVSVGAVAPSNQAYLWPLPSEEIRFNKLAP